LSTDRNGYGRLMPAAPDPMEIYERSEREGRRRLSMSMLEQTSTAFVAGITIVFGMAAMGVVESLATPRLGDDLGRLLGALGFALGLVFLIVGRTELFTENFFGPVAAAIDGDGQWGALLRLWVVTLVFNLIGGAVLLGVLAVDGALPSGAHDALDHIAEEIADKAWMATMARAILAGALLTLLSYMLNAVDSVTSRILLAYAVGFFLALGPFDHVVVSSLHLLLGMWQEADVGYGDIGKNLGLATAGNLIGGVFLMTLTHTAQVKGAREGAEHRASH
jgi:formate-nitrite transporter family protein